MKIHVYLFVCVECAAIHMVLFTFCQLIFCTFYHIYWSKVNLEVPTTIKTTTNGPIFLAIALTIQCKWYVKRYGTMP